MAKQFKVADAVHLCIAADVPALLVGPPRVGKSTLVRALAYRLDRPFVDFRIPYLQSDSLTVEVIDDRNNRLRILFTPELEKAMTEPVILCVEELTCQANRSVRACLLSILAEKEVRGMALHPDVRRVSCCNPTDTAAEPMPLDPAVSSRFALIEYGYEPGSIRVYAKRLEEKGNKFDAVLPDTLLNFNWDVDPRDVGRVLNQFMVRAEAEQCEFDHIDINAEFAPGIPAPKPGPGQWELVARLYCAAMPAFAEDRDRAWEAFVNAAKGLVGDVIHRVVEPPKSRNEKVEEIERAMDHEPPDWDKLAEVNHLEWIPLLREMSVRVSTGKFSRKAFSRTVLWMYGNKEREAIIAVATELVESLKNVAQATDDKDAAYTAKILSLMKTAVEDHATWKHGSVAPRAAMNLKHVLDQHAKLKEWPPSQPEGKFKNGYHGIKLDR